MRPIDLVRSLKGLIGNRLCRKDPAPPYRYQTGDVVLNDFVEYSGIPLELVVDKVRAATGGISETQQEWNALPATSFADRSAKYYGSAQNFVFDTLAANPRPEAVIAKLDRFNPGIMTAIRAHSGKRFFEFGGGIGVFCEIVARMGKDVYYMEVPGRSFDFARWRFQKYGLKVTVIEAKSDRIDLSGKYDIIYTDAVIEHLPPPLQIQATNAIGQGVEVGGLLIFLVDLSGPTARNPMHHDVDIGTLHKQLSCLGLRCDDGLQKFCSIWRRP